MRLIWQRKEQKKLKIKSKNKHKPVRLIYCPQNLEQFTSCGAFSIMPLAKDPRGSISAAGVVYVSLYLSEYFENSVENSLEKFDYSLKK